MKFNRQIQSVVPALLLLTPSIIYAQEEKPNIIFILADDLGWADLPCYGNRFNETPGIDRLAAEGMRFTNAYAACPVCSPTRASIMSGQYPARVGIIDFIPGHWRPYEKVTVPRNRTQYLPQEIFTIGEAMKEMGYATGYFGKWHLGDKPDYHPARQGFDEANVGQGYYNTKFDPPREQSSEKIISERLTEFSIDFIEKNKDKPFFLFLAHWDVHCLIDADQGLINKYLSKEKVEGYPCNAIYAAQIEHIDNSTGRIMQKLEDLGLDKTTVIFFFSDNGGVTTENKYPGVEDNLMPMVAPSKRSIYKNSPLQYVATSNAPLRGEKGSVYEGGIREPLIVRWPGKIQCGTVSKALVSSVDFFPTMLDLGQGKFHRNQILDGESIVPELTGNGIRNERAIFWHYPVYHHDVPAGAVRQGEWKLIENMESGRLSLYKLDIDINEAIDLSNAYPEKTQQLYSLLKAWQRDVNAELPKTNPDFDPGKRFIWGRYPDRPVHSH